MRKFCDLNKDHFLCHGPKKDLGLKSILHSVPIKRKALKSLLALLLYYTYLRAWTLVWSMKFTLLRTTKVFTRIINCFSNFLLPFLSIIFFLFCLSNLGFLQVFFLYSHISVGQLDLRRDRIHSSFKKKNLWNNSS